MFTLCLCAPAVSAVNHKRTPARPPIGSEAKEEFTFDCKKRGLVLSFQLNIEATKDNPLVQGCNHSRFSVFQTPSLPCFFILGNKLSLQVQAHRRSSRWKRGRWLIPAALIIRSHPQECEECGWALAVSRLAWWRSRCHSRGQELEGQW